MPRMRARTTHRQGYGRARIYRGAPDSPLQVEPERKPTHLDEQQRLILEHLWENPEGSTKADLRAAAGVQTIDMALVCLKAEGRLRTEGLARKTRYFAA